MKIGIMQPYLFPYIGYWQLISAVDEFVILDDVNFIKRGYINRNSLLINGMAKLFTVPIACMSQNKLIMETKLSFDKKEKDKFIKMLDFSYKKASEYSNVMPLIENIIYNEEEDLTKYIYYQLLKICDYLGIKTGICRSSELEKNNKFCAQERIIEICRKKGADIYINPSGGRKLYDHSTFQENGITLFFIDVNTSRICYRQYNENFVGNLSIIDVMMFNKVKTIQRFLEEYELNA